MVAPAPEEETVTEPATLPGPEIILGSVIIRHERCCRPAASGRISARIVTNIEHDTRNQSEVVKYSRLRPPTYEVGLVPTGISVPDANGGGTSNNQLRLYATLAGGGDTLTLHTVEWHITG